MKNVVLINDGLLRFLKKYPHQAEGETGRMLLRASASKSRRRVDEQKAMLCFFVDDGRPELMQTP